MSATQARAYIKLGRKAERQGDLQGAERYYRLSLQVDPDSSAADEAMLRRNVRSFPQRRAIRAMLLTRMADLTWTSYQKSKEELSDFTPKVFMYWGQGFEQAPPVVRSCLAATKSLHNDKEVILLDNDNLTDWVTLPDAAWKSAERYRAAFSDMLRIELLSKLGGIWIDATCLPTSNLVDKFDEMVGNSGFFVFKHETADSMSSWFMAARPNSYICSMFSSAMRLYWSVFDRPITYYYMHQIWIQLYSGSSQLRV